MSQVITFLLICLGVVMALHYVQNLYYKRQCRKLEELFVSEFGTCTKFEHKADGAYHVYTGKELFEVRLKRNKYIIKEKKALLSL